MNEINYTRYRSNVNLAGVNFRLFKTSEGYMPSRHLQHVISCLLPHDFILQYSHISTEDSSRLIFESYEIFDKMWGNYFAKVFSKFASMP